MANVDFNLGKIVSSLEYLCDIRNLDSINPVAVRLQHPVSGAEFVIIGSYVEPRTPLVPQKGIWVDFDPSSLTYRTCLRLVDFIANPLTPNWMYTWEQVFTQQDLFTYPQSYDLVLGLTGPIGPQGDIGPIGPVGLQGLIGAKGETGLTGPQGIPGPIGPQGLIGIEGQQGLQGIQGLPGQQGIQGLQGASGPAGPIGIQGVTGPIGPAGPKGDKGDTGVVDYDYILSQLKTLTALVIQGVSTLDEGKTTSFTADASFTDGSTQVDVLPVTWTSPIDLGTIDSSGLFTAVPLVFVDQSGDITGTFTNKGSSLTASKPLTVKAVPYVVSLEIVGATYTAVASQKTYSLVAVLSDGSSGPVVATSWAMVTPLVGSISSGGVFNPTAAPSNVAIIQVEYIDTTGQSIVADFAVYVTATAPSPVVVNSLEIVGSTHIVPGSSSAYSVTALLSDGLTQAGVSVNWAYSGSLGTIDSSGTFTAGPTAKGVANVLAAYNLGNGNSATTQINIAIY